MNNSTTILLVDDDIELCESIRNLLTQHGFHVLLCHSSQQVEQMLKSHPIDLVLLDIILPGDIDGIMICKLIRQLTAAPIIMLTGVAADVEKIVSLEMGADHYITKPFNSRVLLAHIHASLRRLNRDATLVDIKYQIYEFQNFRLNVTSRLLLSPESTIIKLTSTEFHLLHAFLQHPQFVLTRTQLLDFINVNSEAYDRSIDILVSRLRAKLSRATKDEQIINTVRNGGYVLSCYVTKQSINSADWKFSTK